MVSNVKRAAQLDIFYLTNPGVYCTEGSMSDPSLSVSFDMLNIASIQPAVSQAELSANGRPGLFKFKWKTRISPS